MSEKKAKDEKKKTKDENKKVDIIQQLSSANTAIDMMTAVGEVAGYCSKVLKKSKLGWLTPAALLYK